MGTLTGSTPALAEHCPHKLPTSCRLTATARCCACQDKRPHSSTYSVYVDGIGLVNRATRWQRYCYFCREFWSNRLAATDPPLDFKETRIPDIPDQSSFLDRWFEFHRGYRIEKNETDGSENKIEVKCETPWREVDPGMLPLMGYAARRAVTRVDRQQSAADASDTEHVSLDAALDSLLNDANVEAGQDSNRPNETARRHPTERAYDTVDAALQEAVNRMEETERIYRAVESRRDSLHQEYEAVERSFQETLENWRQARRAHRVIEREIRSARAQPPSRASHFEALRLARVYGTREEIESQGAEYVSPLTSMFTRADERYRIAEEVRAEERATDATAVPVSLLWEAIRPDPPHSSAIRVQQVVQPPDPSLRTLDDKKDDRPPPMTDKEMTVNLACKICLQQKADTAVLPCGHLVMCSYCADIWVPTVEHDKTRPIGRCTCPLCRRHIKRKVGIFHA